MIDYKNLEALYWVVKSGSFEKAGDRLFVSQSAITQRIRQLEEVSGQIVLKRTKPPEATKNGLKLLEHFKKVKLLEEDLDNLTNTNDNIIQLAVNADSIYTWFKDVVIDYYKLGRGYLEIIVADQDKTRELLDSGDVMGCVSSYSQKVRGCNKYYLGCMNYYFVCTNEFYNKYFFNGLTYKALESAPKLNFNRDDNLINKWAADKFNRGKLKSETHYLPSSDLFPELILSGSVCGVLDEYSYNLHKKKLVNITGDKPLKIDLYLHIWSIESKELSLIKDLIINKWV